MPQISYRIEYRLNRSQRMRKAVHQHPSLFPFPAFLFVFFSPTLFANVVRFDRLVCALRNHSGGCAPAHRGLGARVRRAHRIPRAMARAPEGMWDMHPRW